MPSPHYCVKSILHPVNLDHWKTKALFCRFSFYAIFGTPSTVINAYTEKPTDSGSFIKMVVRWFFASDYKTYCFPHYLSCVYFFVYQQKKKSAYNIHADRFRSFHNGESFLLGCFIDFYLSLYDRLHIVFAPFIHRIKNWHQTFSMFGQ